MSAPATPCASIGCYSSLDWAQSTEQHLFSNHVCNVSISPTRIMSDCTNRLGVALKANRDQFYASTSVHNSDLLLSAANTLQRTTQMSK